MALAALKTLTLGVKIPRTTSYHANIIPIKHENGNILIMNISQPEIFSGIKQQYHHYDYHQRVMS